MWFSSGREISQRFEGFSTVDLEDAESILRVSFTRITRYDARPYGSGDVYEIFDEIEDEEYELDGEHIDYTALVRMFGSEAESLIDRAIMAAN